MTTFDRDYLVDESTPGEVWLGLNKDQYDWSRERGTIKLTVEGPRVGFGPRSYTVDKDVYLCPKVSVYPAGEGVRWFCLTPEQYAQLT
jgi:hypothetical protein